MWLHLQGLLAPGGRIANIGVHGHQVRTSHHIQMIVRLLLRQLPSIRHVYVPDMHWTMQSSFTVVILNAV